MNEFIYVEFIFPQVFAVTGSKLLQELEDDFVIHNSEVEWDIESDYSSQGFIGFMHVKGKINSATATALKLQNSPLVEYMRVSFIPADLKNKYRK